MIGYENEYPISCVEIDAFVDRFQYVQYLLRFYSILLYFPIHSGCNSRSTWFVQGAFKKHLIVIFGDSASFWRELASSLGDFGIDRSLPSDFKKYLIELNL